MANEDFIPAGETTAAPVLEDVIEELEVEQLVEKERCRLMRALSVLQCASLAMQETASLTTEDPYFPDVIDVAAKMVHKAINKLDRVKWGRVPTLEKFLPTAKGPEKSVE